MKLFCIIAAIVALAVSEELESIQDLEEAATMELMKQPIDGLEVAASNYVANKWESESDYGDGQSKYARHPYVPPQNSYVPPQNSYVPPQNTYVPPQNTYVPPQNSYVPPQNTYVPPQNVYVPPQNTYVPTQKPYVPPQNNYNPPGNYRPPQNTYYPTIPPTSTTTPSSVIKNELTYGDNGSYKYEYEIADGTHVAEEGYFTQPNSPDESLVKKGWYSYPGADGKVYTVTWWADHTGYHASGDHLPTPPPVPAAIQAALDQNAKEEAAKAEAEKNKPSTGYYPTKPTHDPPQQSYKPPQPTYNPPQPTYNPPQHTYKPQQPTYNPPQTYYPPQSNYNPNQQYYPQQPNQPTYGK